MIFESRYVDRVQAGAELHDAQRLVADLLVMCTVCTDRTAAYYTARSMLCVAAGQLADATNRWHELHKPARPYRGA